jgi:Kef-type K+ transport system membrane component KefB
MVHGGSIPPLHIADWCISGFDYYDSLIFGVGVMPRAGIELVVISAGRSMGIIGDEIFSAIVLMVAVSVIVSPVLLKFAVKMKETRITPESTAQQA